MMTERMDDMLKRYGEVCAQKTAAMILSVGTRTIFRMMQEGRLRRIGHKVDVRSIAEYIEGTQKSTAQHADTCPKAQMSQNDFLNAARKGHWNAKGV